MKRVFDVVIASLLFALLAPLMIAIALLVKLYSPGKIIFRQTRLGMNDSTFTLFKFRTMYENSGPVAPVVEGDQRVTRFGRFLRPTHLDELPQLWNVLKGDMHLVGPRPLPLEIVKLRTEQIPDFRLRLQMKPGLTGLAQLDGRQTFDPQLIEHRFKQDMDYIKNNNLFIDAKILMQTIKVVALRNGV